ncbi:MAG: sigma-70 family RNA polymerase sigma factor [Proteobacteria bacterium]|nr:sigma-70 family RNA polymerase sigma factor [Pseudomonadota bacterium]
MPAHEDQDNWEKLMQAANVGDGKAYKELLDSFARALRPFIRDRLASLGREGDETEDIVQEALLAIHLKRHTWDQARPLKAWVYAIARYKLVDVLRRRGTGIAIPIEDVAETLADDRAAKEGAAGDIDRLLGYLGERQRRIVNAVTIEGLTAAEAAARLNMSEGAVRVALHRSLKALAAQWRKINP